VPESDYPLKRRHLLTGLCALGVGAATTARGQSGNPAAGRSPQPGDLLVFAFGEREGQTIETDELEIGAQQVFAWPMEPNTRTVRSGSRLNQIILVRLRPEELSEQTLARSVDGIVAYSGICSHTGCDVTDWNDEANRFQCPCHESQFDPADGARVVGGPAPWQLAALPLRRTDNYLSVAGEFEGRVGFQQPGLDPFGL
jgi:Rieske Fe-S protein